MNKNFFCLCPRQYMSFTCDRTWVHWQAKNTHICMCTYTNTHKDKQIEPKSTYYAWCTLILSFVLYLFYSILFLQTKSPDPLIGLDYRIWKKFLQPVFHTYVSISLLHFFLSSWVISMRTHSFIPSCNMYLFWYCFKIILILRGLGSVYNIDTCLRALTVEQRIKEIKLN